MERKWTTVALAALLAATAAVRALEYPPYDVYGYLADETDDPPLNYMKVCEPGVQGEANASYVVLGISFPRVRPAVAAGYEGPLEIPAYTTSILKSGTASVGSLLPFCAANPAWKNAPQRTARKRRQNLPLFILFTSEQDMRAHGPSCERNWISSSDSRGWNARFSPSAIMRPTLPTSSSTSRGVTTSSPIPF